MKVLPLSKYEQQTNKKKTYAAILLEQGAKAGGGAGEGAGDGAELGHTQDALGISFIIQLLAAYYSLLEELQRRMNLTPQPGLNALELAELMRKQSIFVGEMDKVVELEVAKSSWLNQARGLYRKLTSSPADEGGSIIGSDGVGAGGAGDAADVSQKIADGEVDFEAFAVWLEEFEELCDRLREALSES